jgi:hypothetical protein
MRYVVNNSPLTRDKVTGIELVTRNVITSVTKFTENVVYVNWGNSSSRLYKVIWSLFLVNLDLKRGDIYISPDGISPVIKRNGVKYVSIVHDDIWKSNKWSLEYIYYQLGVYGLNKWVYPIFVSSNTQKRYGLNDLQSTVVYNIKLKSFKNINSSREGFVIIAPSTFRKNFYNQLVAWHMATEEASVKSDLTVVGSYTEADLESFLDQFPAARSRINLVGYISDSVKERLLLTSEFVLCGSRSEGLGHPFIEAIEHGAIPIAQALPSYKEMVFYSSKIPFSKSADSSHLKDLIVRLLTDEEFKIRTTQELNKIANRWMKYSFSTDYLKCFEKIEAL